MRRASFAALTNVRFAPDSGAKADMLGGPVSARRRLSACEPSPSYSGLLLKDERLCLAESIESASR
jgi:hypothetical protein